MINPVGVSTKYYCYLFFNCLVNFHISHGWCLCLIQ